MISTIFFTLLSLGLFILAVAIRQRLGLKSLILTESIFVFLWGLASFVAVAFIYFTGNTRLEMLLLTIAFEPIETFNIILRDFFNQFVYFLVLCFVFLLVAFFYYKYLKVQHKKHNSPPPPPSTKNGIKAYLFVSFLFLLSFIAHPFVQMSYDFVSDTLVNKKSENEFKKYYKTPTLNQKPNNKNLVIIYAESLEKSFFDETVLPELTTDLKLALKDFTIFSDVRQSLKGQSSIDAAVMTNCGIHPFIPFAFHANHITNLRSIKTYMLKAICLGDILNSFGYEMEYLSSNPEFAKTDILFQTHKNAIVKKAKITEKGMWNLASDDAMLKQAFEEYKSIKDNNKSFIFLLATMDTHAPDGSVSKVCQKDPYKHNKEPILQAVHCTSKLIAEFINKIRAVDDNTTIVLLSDHLMMRDISSFYKKQRKNLIAIFDKDLGVQTITKPIIYEDLAPIILYLLGIDTDLGFGRNIFLRDSLSKSVNTQELFSSFRPNIEDLW